MMVSRSLGRIVVMWAMPVEEEKLLSSSINTNNTISSTTSGGTSSMKIISGNKEVKKIPEPTSQFHTPPINSETGTYDPNYYNDNPTIFGKILTGKLPSSSLAESNTLYAFQDINPAAPLHGLVIPKQRIPSVLRLTPNDLPMLYEMKEMGESLVDTYTTVSSTSNNNTEYRLVFHIPPFYSVDHLHLHVLAPVKDVGWFYRQWKYPSTEVRWCTHIDNVIRRLEQGKSPVPYNIRRYSYRR